MKLSLHDALKDPRMKYPRVANRLLDMGMLLLIAGVIAISAVVLGMLPSDSYFIWSLVVFGMGFVSVVTSKVVAEFETEAAGHDDGGSPRLRLVK